MTAAKIDRPTAYQHRNTDEAFRKQWDDALTAALESLEDYCWERAKHGVKRGVWMKDETGKPIKVEEVATPSDVLAIQLLKAHKPAFYREQKGATDLSAVVTTNDKGETKTEFSVHVNAEELP